MESFAILMRMENRNRFEQELLDYDVAVAGFDDGHDAKLKMDLVARTKSIPECALISLSGYIDEHNYKHFQKLATLAVASGFSKIIFDCSELTYISSIGMGSFPVLLSTAKHEGGGIVLLRPQAKVYDVFQLLGFSRYFPKIDSLEDAIRYFVNMQRETFPKVFSCPICSKKLRVSQPGRFRCTGCKTIIVIDKAGEIKANLSQNA